MEANCVDTSEREHAPGCDGHTHLASALLLPPTCTIRDGQTRQVALGKPPGIGRSQLRSVHIDLAILLQHAEHDSIGTRIFEHADVLPHNPYLSVGVQEVARPRTYHHLGTAGQRQVSPSTRSRSPGWPTVRLEAHHDRRARDGCADFLEQPQTGSRAPAESEVAAELEAISPSSMCPGTEYCEDAANG